MTKKSIADQGPLLINETDLSIAWAKALLHLVDHSGNEISPLIVSITGFNKQGKSAENASIRNTLDSVLLPQGKVEDIAFTIFPERIWRLAKGNRAKLFAMYKDVFPRYQAMNKAANRRGLYFERLTSYGRGRCDGNQIEWMLSQFESRTGVRHSMYQASIFDPERDHIPDARLRFPCLQHLSFEPTANGLIVNAFYATQQILIKGYGNYLGIAQLGAFMAHEMKTPLIRVNINVGVAKLGIAKTDPALAPLLAAARACIEHRLPLTEVSVNVMAALDIAK